MSLTRAQIQEKTYLLLKAYRDSLAPSDPELPVIQAWVDWRDEVIDNSDANKTLMKSGPGSNPIGNPPPPPGSPA
jgi:hypothetical protein